MSGPTDGSNKSPVLASFTIKIPVDGRDFLMRGILCPGCKEWLGAYSTKKFPEGLGMVTCQYCGATVDIQPLEGQPHREDK